MHWFPHFTGRVTKAKVRELLVSGRAKISIHIWHTLCYLTVSHENAVLRSPAAGTSFSDSLSGCLSTGSTTIFAPRSCFSWDALNNDWAQQSISAGHTCSEIELLYPEAFVYRIPMILVKTFLEEFYDSSYTVFLPFLLSWVTDLHQNLGFFLSTPILSVRCYLS